MKYSDANINELKMEMRTHKDDMIDVDNDDGFCCDDECCYGDD